ncbi:hypothetical protein ACSBR2_034767 [Camellia fascicularis]
MMISLKAMQTSFSPTKHALLFHTRGLFSNKKNPILLSLCKSNNSNSEDSPPPPEGDARKQELLARIAMLQTQKVRLTDYLDERSQYLTQFAEEANAEFDQIGEDALKGLDEASARVCSNSLLCPSMLRETKTWLLGSEISTFIHNPFLLICDWQIMENIESRMQAFEESTELDKQEIEKNVKNLEEFEDQIEKDRNEGMFFKSLMQRKPIEKEKAKDEMEKIKEITIGSAGSKTRRNIYLALIGLVVISIVDSLISSSSEWQKLAILGVILVGLLSQLIYEQTILSERTEKEKPKDEKE